MFHSNHGKQQGSALVVAIFIIVVLSVVGIALTRVINDAAQGVVAEVYGARAYHAAASGIEVFMADELFPPNDDTPNCVAQSYTFNIDGLDNCEANVTCSEFPLPGDFSGTHFQVESVGVCDIGDSRYSRQLAIEANIND
ncbi:MULTISPECIES: pilus assembly PilX N-terminal domain-containing protein [Gammaproteobacteria]|uniref:pilus assembly PilX N-terminal domain-containing protein n=1 Tax=Gammaproteobacteria TaxID=1236 RepID=UPI000DD08DD7|nr:MULTISPECIES: pilus assembly PilX N-terminal domain-containing protein [Gammaproteobacteria]RTE86379.1 type II secretory pathway component [Aliidiomarina sp. B3213]TCZ91727.1 type II secretory pathway component [Lysobacter sp. N42]